MSRALTQVELREDIVAPPRSRGVWQRRRRTRPAVLAAVFLAAVHVLALAGPPLLPLDPFATDPLGSLQLPSRAHLLGTDEVGRDTLARLIYGARVSLLVGLVAMAVAIVTGSVVGGLAGYFGGVVDAWLMRLPRAHI